MASRILLFILICSLAGCIIVPTFGKEPYVENQIAGVRPGTSTRDIIRDRFGKPDYTREEDAIWIYRERHHVAWGTDISGGAGYLYDYQFLVIEFDQNTLGHIELVENIDGCSSTGICLRGGPAAYEDSADGVGGGVVASRREDDRIAKEFDITSNMCALYIYVQSSGYQYDITIDAAGNVWVDHSSYVFVLLEKGAHKIAIANMRKPAEKEFSCNSGESIFVKLDSKIFRGPYIRVVEEDSGRREVLKRDLILLP